MPWLSRRRLQFAEKEIFWRSPSRAMYYLIFDSATVKPGLYSEIDRIGNIMINYPQTSILVEGYTDSVGSEEYNMKLSNRRATAVRDLLVNKGVSSTRIRAIGYGETLPVATNDTPEGRQRNRRVEIKINPSAAAG